MDYQQENVECDTRTEMALRHAQWEKTHGQGALVDKLKNGVFALMEHRLNQDYGDFLPKDPNAVNPEDKAPGAPDDSTWWKANCAEISHRLAVEADVAYTASSWGVDWPATPFHDDVITAAVMLRLAVTTGKIVWEIREYAERNRDAKAVYHGRCPFRGAEALIVEKSPEALGRNVLRDLGSLREFAPLCEGAKERMELAIVAFRDHYFNVCEFGEDGFLEADPRREVWSEKIRKLEMEAEKASNAKYEAADRYSLQFDDESEASERRRGPIWLRSFIAAVKRRLRR